MGMSVSGMSGYSMYQAQPMNLSLSNKAPVSEVYNQRKTVGDIATVSPVVYPNAQEVKIGEVGKTDSQKEARKVNQQFNNIASKFNGNTVGYARDMAALSYGQVGNSFDAFA